MVYLLKIVIIHGYVKLPDGIVQLPSGNMGLLENHHADRWFSHGTAQDISWISQLAMFDYWRVQLEAQLKAILEFPMADDSLSATLLPEGSCVIRNCADLGATLSHWPENQRLELRNCPQPLASMQPPKKHPRKSVTWLLRHTYRSCTSLYPTAVSAKRPAELPKEGMAVATHSWEVIGKWGWLPVLPHW